MQVYDGHGLGCWLGANDPRSNDHLFWGAFIPSRQTVLHSARGPITDQDGVGACVGFTDLDLLNTAKFYWSRRRPHKHNTYMDNAFGYGFYHDATVLDEWHDETWTPDDSGSSVLAGAKALQQAGHIDSYTWSWDFNGFLAALQRQPVMVGTLWTSGMSDPDSTGLIKPTGDIVGGHAYMAFGMNVRSQKIKWRNHWTRDWGDDGCFYTTFDDTEWLISQQGEVLIPKPV